jgi:hypothetical protein
MTRPITIRVPQNPIIRPEMLGSGLGENINGPSLIRVPEWVEQPLGRYYLYFAHHQGTFIRLAYADRLHGPWRIYEPGTLSLEETACHKHIASPDVHVDEAKRELRMFFHGPVPGGGQRSFIATSRDGIRFGASPTILGEPYFRVFQWRSDHYALTRSGNFCRSPDGLGAFEPGPTVFPDIRHSALKLDGDTLSVFYSNVGDRPERILVAAVALTPDWKRWTPSEAATVLEPEMEYEGADLRLAPSRSGLARERVRELRDPAIYREDGRTYLLYSVAGEHGIAIAELKDVGGTE